MYCLNGVVTRLVLPFQSFDLHPNDRAERKNFSHHHPGAHGHRRLPGTHPAHPSNLRLLPTPVAHLLLLGAALAQSDGTRRRPQPRRHGSRRSGRRERRPVVALVSGGRWRRRRRGGFTVRHEQHRHLHRGGQL